MLLELLWLGRLPVGAAIPPDDTQVTVGATVLAFSMGEILGLTGMPMVILAVLIAIPLGKFGQIFDRLARQVNDRLAVSGLQALSHGDTNGLERMHLMGLVSFALASLATACVIVLVGSVILLYSTVDRRGQGSGAEPTVQPDYGRSCLFAWNDQCQSQYFTFLCCLFRHPFGSVAEMKE